MLINLLMIFIFGTGLSLLLFVLFTLLHKASKWELSMFNVFECGFNSYFYSRFSFSIHYFLISLIFLFLDLEICLILLFLFEFQMKKNFLFLVLFVFTLLLSLFWEWKEGKLKWED